jgi:hypothetical protein
MQSFRLRSLTAVRVVKNQIVRVLGAGDRRRLRTNACDSHFTEIRLPRKKNRTENKSLALADDRYPLEFNMTLIGVSIAAMLFGSFFQIRLYVVIGFAGLVVDVMSLVYKTMVTLERSSRMTVIGGLVLLIGVGLVFGAIYYKTNRDKINEQLDRWRKTLGAWE